MAKMLHPVQDLPDWPTSDTRPPERHWLRERFENDEIDLLAIGRTLWQRKWAIVALVALAMMLTTLYISTVTPIYQSVATLLVEQRGARVLSIEQVYGLEGSGREFLQTQVELLKSRALAERVVRRLSLHNHYEFDPAQLETSRFAPQALMANLDLRRFLPMLLPEDLEEPVELTEEERIAAAVGRVMSRVTVEPVRGSQLVLIRVDMADRFTAAEVANALAEGFIESQLEASMDMSLAATNWMSGRLGELRTQLQTAEQQLQAFRDEYDLIDVSGILTVSADELRSTSERMIDARRQRAEAESEFQQVRAMNIEGWERVASVPAVLSNSLVQQFRTQEARARARVEELSGRYGPRHPTMEAAQSDLTSARASLQAQVEQVVASIEQRYRLAVANERALSQAVDVNRDQIQELSRREFQLRALQREVDTNRALYDTFLTRLQETSATVDLEAANARIVDRAIPGRQISPNKPRAIAIAGMLAALLGSGLALLLVALNNTFRGSEEVEEKLNLPVLGIVPLLSKKDRKQMLHMFHDAENKTFAESIRTIRTGVMLTGVDRPHKILLVTSSVPGEGKSTVAVNLAYALGQMEKVLLVEADMRRPNVAKAFDLPAGTPGLANLIMGTASLDEAIHRVDDLDIVNAGLVPPNPLELLSATRFEQVLNELGKRYDRIVIDSPPLQAVSDALVLSRHADGVIYVIRSDSTPRSLGIKGVGQLLQAGAALTGAVLNQVNIKKAQKYGYTYGGYYDYYGYSSGGGKTKAA